MTEALSTLGRCKSDGSNVTSNHLLVAAHTLAEPLSKFFTAILRHGVMPSAMQDCILIPIPKPHKDPTRSDNYRAIALASNFSKLFEKSILLMYGSYFSTSDLQFGFKAGLLTELCTGIVKNVIHKYVKNG